MYMLGQAYQTQKFHLLYTLGWPTSVMERKCVARECTHAIKCACSAMWETPAGLAQQMRLLGLVGLVLMMRGRYGEGRENDG